MVHTNNKIKTSQIEIQSHTVIFKKTKQNTTVFIRLPNGCRHKSGITANYLGAFNAIHTHVGQDKACVHHIHIYYQSVYVTLAP